MVFLKKREERRKNIQEWGKYFADLKEREYSVQIVYARRITMDELAAVISKQIHLEGEICEMPIDSFKRDTKYTFSATVHDTYPIEKIKISSKEYNKKPIELEFIGTLQLQKGYIIDADILLGRMLKEFDTPNPDVITEQMIYGETPEEERLSIEVKKAEFYEEPNGRRTGKEPVLIYEKPDS